MDYGVVGPLSFCYRKNSIVFKITTSVKPKVTEFSPTPMSTTEEYDEVWVEKAATPINKEEILFDDLLSKYSTIDNKVIKNQIKQNQSNAYQDVRDSRELNKDFISKLNPTNNQNSNASQPNPISIGDGGASWLRKSFKRAKEQARETGKPLQQLISERWGSMQNYRRLLDEAEQKERLLLSQNPPRSQQPQPYNKYKQPQPRPYNRKYDKDRSERQQIVEPEKENAIVGDDSFIPPNESKKIIIASETDTLELCYFNRMVDSQTITLNNLNRIGAEYMKYYLEDQIDEYKNTELNASTRKTYKAWAELLVKAQHVFEKQTIHPSKSKSHNTNKKSNQSHHQPKNKSYNRNEQSFNTQNEYEDTHFDILTGQYVTKGAVSDKKSWKHKQDPIATENYQNDPNSKRVKQEIKQSISRNRDATILNYKQAVSAITSCPYCLDSPSMIKHSIISYKNQIYLGLPNRQPLVPYECYLTCINHVTLIHDMEPDVLEDFKDYLNMLGQMYLGMNQTPVLLYTCVDPKKFHHALITIIPIPLNKASDVPMYFKNAILSGEYEWASNKKIIDMGTRMFPIGVVPRELPYFAFSVLALNKEGTDFVRQGFAHVIENAEAFPTYFGKEVLGGLMHIENPNLWRKPQTLPFDVMKTNVFKFNEKWKPIYSNCSQ